MVLTKKKLLTWVVPMILLDIFLSQLLYLEHDGISFKDDTSPTTHNISLKDVNDIMNNTKVYIFPDMNMTNISRAGELKHFQMDGINQSTILEWCHNPMDLAASWVVDLHRGNRRLLLNMVQSRSKLILEKKLSSGNNINLTWKLFLLIWSDHLPITDEPLSSFLIKLSKIGSPWMRIRIATRTTVTNRGIGMEWLNDKPPYNFSIPFPIGNRIDFDDFLNNFNICSTGTIRHLNYAVRTDNVLKMEELLLKYIPPDSHNVRMLQLPEARGGDILQRHVNTLATLERPVDVAHYWNFEQTKHTKNTFRNRVSTAINSLRDEILTINTFTGKVKQAGEAFRNYVNPALLRHFMTCKIIVDTQRDTWEGQYRLFEVLLSGALVMTDPMHFMPDGFEDGKNIIIYWSISDLKQKIQYYLNHEEERIRIAKDGLLLAMQMHRSWHLMESIVLGNWSDTSKVFVIGPSSKHEKH